MAKEIPVWVKVISILHFIGAAVLLLLAIASFIGGGFIATLLPVIGIFGSALFIILGIICLLFAVLAFFIGLGLWKGQNWARIVAIIFSILGALGALGSIVTGSYSSIVMLIIDGAIAGYLLFSKDVKEAFS